ncbi:sensor histidine kinase [Zongyangia hominis]|uniref:Histidine kinase n=1 Tax=Zongyangia hominis TaxID=2763677 RepID=A0A926EC04_9FIRM|nr:histidine kinase [Zongyangia hominis]MBC8570295.1 histidine kinase [Zongyangia hominis]
MDNLTIANIALDIFCLVLCLIPIVYLVNDRRYQLKLNRFFMGISISNAFMIIGDLADWCIKDVSEPTMALALSLLSLLFYISSAFVLYFFARYMDEYLKLSGRVRTIFLAVITALCAVHIFFAAISPFTGAIYYVSASGYQRGPLFMISQMVPLLCYLSFTFLVIWCRKKLTRREVIFFLLYIFIPLGGGAAQMFCRGIAVVNVGVTLALLFIFVNIQSERDLLVKQQEKELAESRIDIMLSQIQPHFLYNALTTIRQLCDVDPKQAKEAVRDFSLFLRGNMDSLKSKAPIPFEQELSHVENYLSLERQRFQGRLQIVYDITARDFSLPPLTLQPIVENAVRHGALSREEGGTVTVHTGETDTAYVITVQDDGLGIRATLEDGRSHVGIENVRGRLSALCGGTLTLDSVAGVGTTAVITIPKEEMP